MLGAAGSTTATIYAGRRSHKVDDHYSVIVIAYVLPLKRDCNTKLAGDQLVHDHYEPCAVAELADGSLQGYSPVLNLNLRWENGQLVWYDPATGRPILTYEDQRDRAVTERERADAERQTRLQEREQADARIRELEDENRRLRNQ